MKLTKTTTVFLFLALVACSKNDGIKSDNEAVFKVENSIITVAKDSPLLQKISIGEVENGFFRHSFTVSGEVRPLPACYAEIAAPFAGRIVKSYIHTGQHVTAGGPIFELSSPEFSETVKSFFQTKQELALAEKSLSRVRDLKEHNAASIKELEESETDCEIKRKEYEQALSALKIWTPEPDKLKAGEPLIVRSPIAGEIVKAEITIGQYVKDDSEALAAVAEIGQVRVIARVREKDIPLVESIDSICVSPVSQPELKIMGKLAYAGAIIDPETRTADMIVECPNPTQALKPNMFATIAFIGREKQVTTVPLGAVLQDDDSRYVIVAESNNRFRKAKITIQAESEGKAIVSAGIDAGEKIVTEGAFYFIEAR
jgi:cobalt-zinc-cadmium efflux system membrane fusion protein